MSSEQDVPVIQSNAAPAVEEEDSYGNPVAQVLPEVVDVRDQFNQVKQPQGVGCIKGLKGAQGSLLALQGSPNRVQPNGGLERLILTSCPANCSCGYLGQPNSRSSSKVNAG